MMKSEKKVNTEIQKNQKQQQEISLGSSIEETITGSSIGKAIVGALDSIADKIFGSQNEVKKPKSDDSLVSRTYSINPGTYEYLEFKPICKTEIQGGFLSKGTRGDNGITVSIIDEGELNILQRGQSPAGYYYSDIVETGTFEVVLNTKYHYIVMDNTHSKSSAKSVQLAFKSGGCLP